MDAFHHVSHKIISSILPFLFIKIILGQIGELHLACLKELHTNRGGDNRIPAIYEPAFYGGCTVEALHIGSRSRNIEYDFVSR